MTKSEVLTLLKENTNERGLVHWEKLGDNRGGLENFGIGLTQLRKLAKQGGRDHELALEVWNTNNHDARIVGLLIDEPKKLTREQAEEQVEQVDAGMLTHVFSSCDATLPKAPFALELAKDWIESNVGSVATVSSMSSPRAKRTQRNSTSFSQAASRRSPRTSTTNRMPSVPPWAAPSSVSANVPPN